MLGQYTTDEGYVLTAYGVGYMDYGLSIENPEGDSIFNCPFELSSECYGVNPPEGLDWEEWQEQGGEGVPWSSEEWKSALE